MKVGLKIGPATDPTVKDAAVRAEEMGFDSLWLSERVAIPLDKPHPYEAGTDPWIGLAFVAAVTTRVQLGTSVSQIALRPPVLMARELATLDRLSSGRLIVGAGAGWVEEEFTSAGVPFDTRGGRLNEFILLLRHLWTKPEEPWNGKHFQVPAVGLVRPLTPGGPPIFVGAGASPGINRAARHGDGFLSAGLPPDSLGKLRVRLDELRASFGRTGHFPLYSQVSAPVTAEDARDLVQRYGVVGVDSLIVAEGATISGVPFLEREGVARALLESAHDMSGDEPG
ncbi:MAG TPA: TIGR03619 family F420-dependent LLM class oxidoreductase [Dehalococcoidia bacterium]|nr:TIGR03619 family F420-dependent LLM class oxidoreductase [Dehalococcoidia bacterium]